MKQREIPTVRDGDVSKMDGNSVSLTVEGIRYRGKRSVEEEEEEKEEERKVEKVSRFPFYS